MKIAIVGQQDFGKAVLEAFLARGDTVAGESPSVGSSRSRTAGFPVEGKNALRQLARRRGPCDIKRLLQNALFLPPKEKPLWITFLGFPESGKGVHLGFEGEAEVWREELIAADGNPKPKEKADGPQTGQG